jgi:integrase
MASIESEIKFKEDCSTTKRGRVVLYFANRNYGTGITNIKKSYLKNGYLNNRYDPDPLKVKKANDLIRSRKKLIDEIIFEGYQMGIKKFPPFIKSELHKREEFQQFKVATSNLTVAETFQKYLESRLDDPRIKSKGTKDRYYQILSRLEEFEEEKVKVVMSGLNVRWMNSLVEFIGTPRTKTIMVCRHGKEFPQVKQLGMNNATINRTLEELIRFFQWYEENTDDFKLHKNLKRYPLLEQGDPEEDVFALSERQINALRNVGTLKKHLQKTIDLFLFACSTGMAYGDAISTSFKDLQGSERTLTKHRIKNNKKFVVTMDEDAYGIFKKYNMDFRQKFQGDRQINKNLRTVAKLRKEFQILVTKVDYTYQNRDKKIDDIKEEVPFWEVLRFHCGRKTFITKKFIEKESLNKILGMTGLSAGTNTIKHYMDKFGDSRED